MNNWYHGTFEEISRPFFPFTHFGTEQAALEMLGRRYVEDGERSTPMMYVAHISYNSPLDAPDFDSPEPLTWIRRLEEFGAINSIEASNLKQSFKALPKGYENRIFRLQAMAEFFSLKSFDCLQYENIHEALGSVSIAPINDNQIEIINSYEVDLAAIETVWLKLEKSKQFPWPNC